jgi:hypothetical protein
LTEHRERACLATAEQCADIVRDPHSDDEEDADADRPRQHVFGELVRNVLRADLARLQHCEASVHEEDEERHGERPHQVHPCRKRLDVGRFSLKKNGIDHRQLTSSRGRSLLFEPTSSADTL